MKNKTKNQINVIEPYRTLGGTWVYDDPDVPVYAEAFVMGSSELIDSLVGTKVNNLTVCFSSKPLPEVTIKLTNIDKEKESEIKGWYRNEVTGSENWFCGHLLDYFPDYPEEIYVKILLKE